MLLSRLEQQEGEKNETAFFLQDTNAVFTMTAVDSLGFESRAWEEKLPQGRSFGSGVGSIGCRVTGDRTPSLAWERFSVLKQHCIHYTWALGIEWDFFGERSCYLQQSNFSVIPPYLSFNN